MKSQKIKSERRIAKKKKRRYPMSGRGVFTIARIQKTRGAASKN